LENTKKTDFKSNKYLLIQELEKSGAEFKGTSCRCPFCDDKNPSAGIYEREGFWFYKCHKCGFQGDIFSVIAKSTGMTEVDVLKDMTGARPKEKKKKYTTYKSLKESTQKIKNLKQGYRYVDPETGKDKMYVLRIEQEDGKKTFLQGSPHGDGGIILKSPPKPHPIYKGDEVLKKDHVVCVEGEKCVLAINEVGNGTLCATTSPGGAGKAHFSDWSILAGKKVYLWPDNDDVGVDHMKELSGILEKLKPHPTILWVDPNELGLEKKEDVYDFLAKYDTKEEKKKQLQAVLANAQQIGAASEVIARFRDISDGKRETIRLPWDKISKYTKAIKPGTVTLICGEGGAAKSYLLLQLCQYWHFDLGHEVAVYELEDDRAYHVTRALAQKMEITDLMDDDWIAENDHIIGKIEKENLDFMNEVGRMIFEAPIEPVSLADLAKWVDEQARSGKRIICIDPITAATPTKEVWVADQEFITAAKKSIVKHGASLVLVTHPKKGGSNDAGLDNLSGGACWARFSQTILWLRNLGTKQEHDILDCGLKCKEEAERIMWILKARNGYGGGRKFAMTLDGLKLKEVGEIVKSKKGK